MRIVKDDYGKWKASWNACRKCDIGEEAFRHVLCDGRLNAKFLFIGEAPGQAEDLNGKPFIGPAGELFRQVLYDAGFKKVETMIANCLACRPALHKPNGTIVNRSPTNTELTNCKKRIWELVELMPELKAVGLVGATAQQQFGTWFDSAYPRIIAASFTHPAALLRNGIRAGIDLGKTHPERKRRYLKYMRSYKAFRRFVRKQR